MINEDRWLGSSDSWLEAGAPHPTYREMVLNHETGHWLGFGHVPCPTPGAPAPVMEQQSMTLTGCAPNAWPRPAERAMLAARWGVPILPAGEIIDPACLRLTAPLALGTWMRCF